MEKYTLIGCPLGHSMSPFIHKRLFEMAKREADYELTEILKESFSEKANKLSALSGYNITIPYKVDIIPFLDSLDESAKRYNSVNCVKNENGVSIGYNTDCDGFLRSVKDFPLNGKVLLIGCGGVGRMMAIEAALHGAKLTIGIIEAAKNDARKLSDEIQSHGCDAPEIILTSDLSGNYDIIINASPVGMYPKSDACPVSDELIQNCTAIFDAIYNPVKTQLVSKALSYGKMARGGMSMLVLQAVRAHEIWNGDSYSDDDINALIKECEKVTEEAFK